MRKGTGVAALAVACLLGACSPYVYKEEVAGFHAGVDGLGSAYHNAMDSLKSHRLAQARDDWVTQRAVLRTSAGCAVITPPAQACVVHEARKDPVGLTATEAEAAEAALLVKVLRDYTKGLLAITDAQDRVALDKAQAKLEKNIVALAKLADSRRPGQPPLAAGVGALTALAGRAAAATLDQMRYNALRRGVLQADPAVAVLGTALGETLTELKDAEHKELLEEIDALQGWFSRNASRRAADGDYRARLVALDARTAAIDALGAADPAEAARTMVKAHAELREALESGRGQATAVADTISDFVDKAQAVEKAFATPDPKASA